MIKILLSYRHYGEKRSKNMDIMHHMAYVMANDKRIEETQKFLRSVINGLSADVVGLLTDATDDFYERYDGIIDVVVDAEWDLQEYVSECYWAALVIDRGRWSLNAQMKMGDTDINPEKLDELYESHRAAEEYAMRLACLAASDYRPSAQQVIKAVSSLASADGAGILSDADDDGASYLRTIIRKLMEVADDD